ncbi:hypothetical protein CANINC_003686 [Pichia inconspicua]|uniref:Amino acid permease/ SLC12A domain-containing protein n=1 Tax=Pichia inconspicua TaxID=52247 RepID=A0A4T0WY00_9ASCO|nr:hypothetical protein CANINC_003686 [[Candida] inconspicua]
MWNFFTKSQKSDLDVSSSQTTEKSNSIEQEIYSKKQTYSFENLENSSSSSDDSHLTLFHNEGTKRLLKARHIDLISIGGSIGTGLFVTIGTGLMNGGCGNLLIAFTIQGFIIYLVTLSIGELICYLPVDSPFITHAGRFVDPAFEFCVGMNFYIMISLYIPFEITSVNSMIHFWRDDYSPAAAFVPQIVIYLVLNIFAVRWFGESEFILSIGKMILAIGLLFFTFITMVGGNPQHHAFGFSNFKGLSNAFPQYLGSGASAFWAAYMKAVFTEVAPEYLGMIAGEARNPRRVLPRAFKTIIYRLAFFYVLGSLSVGILVKHNDPALVTAVSQGAAGANVSPYVISMKNMGINVLPSIVNVLCISAAFSAGNSYVYCSSRALYAMSKRGLAPKFFSICLKNGVPIYCIAMAVGWSCLSLLQLGDAAAVALDWMVNLCTGGQILNYFFMMITYLFFFRACKVQGVDRFTMPLQAWTTKLQPYPAIFALVCTWLIVMFLGYQSFLPSFNIDSFLYYYLMFFIACGTFTFWKLYHRTSFVKPDDADLFSGLAEIDEHERKIFADQHEKPVDNSFKGKLIRNLWWSD